MHAQLAALAVVSDSLDHRSEDVWVDLLPVELARAKQVSAGSPAKVWAFGRAGE